MKDIMNKMIERPFSTILVVGVLVNGVSVLLHNVVMTFRR